MNIITYLPSFINTAEFSKEALFFEKNKFYISAPEGTFAHKEYWDEQTRRCLEGYSIGGVRITGPHYFYLNFCRIQARTKEGRINRKKESFPSFLDMDYYYFHEVEKAQEEGKGLCITKARRKGFSFKNACLCTYQYNFFRNSNSIIGAYLNEYAQATMDMVLDMVNFLNINTAWKKRRDLKDTREHIQAGYKVDKNSFGYKSQIYTFTFKDNASASIGKSASLFLFEEAGKWPNLIESYKLSQFLFMDGNIATGTALIFGTAKILCCNIKLLQASSHSSI